MKEVIVIVKFIVKRIAALIPVLIIVSFVVFMLVHLAPGDPAVAMLGGAKTTPEILENINNKYHFKDPVIQQYGYWITDVVKGDFGDSYKYNEPVAKLIATKFPITLQLIIMSTLFAILLSLPMGIASGVKHNTAIDNVLSFISVIFMSTPSFLVGMLLMLLFSYQLGILPNVGTGSGVFDNIRYMIMPAISLGLCMVAINARTLRSSMINVMESNYIETARAKGISMKKVVFKHALKNAIIPYITITGVQLASLIGTSSIIESTFGISGIGSLIVNGVLNNDYVVVQGTTLFLVIVILLINLLVDIICAVIDKRIQSA